MKPESVGGQLKLLFSNSGLVPCDLVRHGSSLGLLIVNSISNKNGFGRKPVRIAGSAFLNRVKVKFDDAIAEPVKLSAGAITLRIPKKRGIIVLVDNSVLPGACASKDVILLSRVIEKPCEGISIDKRDIKNSEGEAFFKTILPH